MQRLNVADIIAATDGSLVCGEKDFEISEITTDSRKAGANMLFVPIIGENNDGHDYIPSAFENGAGVVITQKEIAPVAGKNIVLVKDTRLALGDIARYYKSKYNLPTVSITGSVGKTTTKDMISAVLAMKYNTLKTQGNFNNDIGLPLTVFRLEHKHQIAVIEMGMSHMGEIHYLASIAKPDTAVITNVGMSHIENLGSQEKICESKMQICDFFTKDNLLILNGDDRLLAKQTGGFKIVTYGIKNRDCDLVARDIRNFGIDGTRFAVTVGGKDYDVAVKIPGEHNVYNALAAIAVGLRYYVPMEDIIDGIREFQLTGMRMEIKKHNRITVIDDCYNASPDSMRAAIKVLSDIKAKRKIAIMGDVLEIGGFAEKALYEVGTQMDNIDVLITVGENSKYIAKGADFAGLENIFCFEMVDEVLEFLNDFIEDDDTVLVKASRGMHCARIVDALKQR